VQVQVQVQVLKRSRCRYLANAGAGSHQLATNGTGGGGRKRTSMQCNAMDFIKQDNRLSRGGKIFLFSVALYFIAKGL